ncbi:hypothetical protein RI367_007542 [Sorochytrium milnesiophthora]
MRSSVKVAVRLRPAPQSAVRGLQVAGDEVSTGVKAFNFDRVWDEAASQQDVAVEVEPIADSFLSGMNVTVLAYGQTGSGKSYSMGTAASEGAPRTGIIPQTLEYIFGQLGGADYEAEVTFCELYNEHFLDLLSTTPWSTRPRHSAGQSPSRDSLQLREESSGVYVEGLTATPVDNAEDCIDALHAGLAMRTTASTMMNVNSSRSHAVFTVLLRQLKSQEGGLKVWTRSKFHFVDLAGSERLKRTQAEGDRRREGIAINAGLLALGNVIAALTDEKQPIHIPYRNSKLTRLLQDSLGGNSQTLFLACASPLQQDLAETINTLGYASRARRIQNKCRINISVDTPAQAPRISSEQVARLLQENASLKQQLHDLRESVLHGAKPSVPAVKDSNSREAAELRERYLHLLGRLDRLRQDALTVRHKHAAHSSN